nr:homeobox protein HMX1 [Odocoileus virginianus texanus]
MPDELTEPGRATPARASSFLIENLLAAEAKGAGRGAQGGGGREEEEDDDDDPEDEDAERARRRRLQRRRQLRAGSGPSGETGPPYALGCGGAARWYSRSHGGYGGGLSPDRAAASAALPFQLAPAAPAPPPPLLGFSGALAYPLAAFPAAASAPFLRAQMPGLV